MCLAISKILFPERFIPEPDSLAVSNLVGFFFDEPRHHHYILYVPRDTLLLHTILHYDYRATEQA